MDSVPSATAASFSAVSFSYAAGLRIRWYRILLIAMAVVSAPTKPEQVSSECRFPYAGNFGDLHSHRAV